MTIKKYITIIIFCFVFFISDCVSFAQIDKVYTLNDTTIAKEYFDIGNSFVKKSKNDSSIIFFKKSLDIYENLTKQFDQPGLWLKYVQTLNYVGYNLCYMAQYDESKLYLEKAKDLCFEKLGKDNKTAAQNFQAQGIFYDFTGDYQQSLEMFREALKIRIKIYGVKHSDIADTYTSIGIMYAKLSNLDMSLQYFFKALDIVIALNGEEDSRTAVTYNNIGNIYKDKGDYGKALEYHQKSLAIRLKVLGEQNYLTASSYNNIGIVYYNIEDFEKAKENHLKSLSIRINVLGDKHDLVATSYNNLGLVFWKTKDLKDALEYFNHALDIRLELFNQNHPSISESYDNIGLVYYDDRDYDKAIDFYNKALAVWNNLGNNKILEISKIYQNLAEVYIKKNDFDSALTFIQKAIIELVPDFNELSVNANPKLNGIQSEPLLLNSLKIKSKIFTLIASEPKIKIDYKALKLKEALSTLELADSLIDMMRVGYKTESSKFFLGEKSAPIYEQAIESSLHLYELTQLPIYKEKAFYFIEKSKAAVLQEGIIESKATKFAKLPPNLIDDEKNLKIDLTFYETQLQNELRKKDLTDSTKVLEYESKLFGLNNKYDEFISDLEKNYPAYYNLKYQIKTKSVYDVQLALDNDCAILEYFVGDSTIYAVGYKQK